MQRWHLTFGLAALAVVGAVVAPRLVGAPLVTEPDPALPDPPPAVVDVPQPHPDGTLTLHASLDRAAVLQDTTQERFLVVTLGAPRDVGVSFRRPIDLGVVMDVSGSMSARGRIDYAKKAAKLLASAMEPDDTFGLVTFNDFAKVVVPATSIDDPWPIHQAIDAVWEGGGTNLYAGLELGATEIRRSLRDGQVGRMVLLSDGLANQGITDPVMMSRLVGTLASQGVTVSTVGLGEDFNEDLMQQLADVGGGTYGYVDDPRALTDAFAAELDRSASTVARGTRLEIALPAGVEGLEVIGWDAERTADGFALWMGDIYAGDQRKIIARVRVTGSSDASMAVASVRATYTDLVEDRAASAVATATATTTTEVARVEASVDRDVAIEAARAWGNEVLVRSTHAYMDGDKTRAKALAQESQQLLRSAAATYAAPELEEDASRGDAQEAIYDRYAPTAPEAKGSVKKAKETILYQTRGLNK